MTPKEKAKELIDKYLNVGDQEFDYSKEFALIAVDEILKSNPCYEGDAGNGYFMWYQNTHYWEQVKHEIKKL